MFVTFAIVSWLVVGMVATAQYEKAKESSDD